VEEATAGEKNKRSKRKRVEERQKASAFQGK